MIANDRILLGTCVKNIQNALSKGVVVYKSCLSFSKFVEAIEKQIKENEKKLVDISHSFDPLHSFVSNWEGQVISWLDKIKSLTHDKDNIVGELQSLITWKLDTMISDLKEAQDAMATYDPIDLQLAEMHAFLFSGIISVLECLKKGWDSHLNSLKNIFANIFKFMWIRNVYVYICCCIEFLYEFWHVDPCFFHWCQRGSVG